MVEEVFTVLSGAMAGAYGAALAASFAWGLASVLLSPCHLASIPLLVGFILKMPVVSLRRTASLSLLFAGGNLVTILLLGVVTASLGRIMGDVGMPGNIVVALVFFVIGLYLLDILSLSWWTPPVPRGPAGSPWRAALVLGLLFGIGLGPCTFAYLAPVLGVVLTMADTRLVQALLLILAFGAGHCLVIAAAGSLAHRVQAYLLWTDRSRTALWLKRATGVLVILGGVYFLSTIF